MVFLALPTHPMFSRSAIHAGLAPDVRLAAVAIECVRHVHSTNACLLARARSGNIHGHVLLAESQQSGKGRFGRRWYSPPRAGLYLSMGWRTTCPAWFHPLFSLASGVAVVRAVADIAPHCPVRLKWPNDVIVNGNKLGGILLECRRHTGDTQFGLVSLVIGVGLNMRLPLATRALLRQPCTDLERLLGVVPSGNTLAAAVIRHLFLLFRESGWSGSSASLRVVASSWLAEWRRHDACLGREAELRFAGNRITGHVEGVDDMGHLLLRVGSQQQAFSMGSLRLLPTS